ncbi:hypothetical protein VNO80_07545 [Phaseolus coccineus]|uniref:Uncharacterized protein n=1 Tax=Phaseolus coccineus TaxID=3886 RepID=A0AAN9RJQ7_PHACN
MIISSFTTHSSSLIEIQQLLHSNFRIPFQVPSLIPLSARANLALSLRWLRILGTSHLHRLNLVHRYMGILILSMLQCVLFVKSPYHMIMRWQAILLSMVCVVIVNFCYLKTLGIIQLAKVHEGGLEEDSGITVLNPWIIYHSRSLMWLVP